MEYSSIISGVVSSSSSLPEVCGDLVDYVAPTDLDGLVQAVYRAVIDDDYRRRREQAIAQASLRSWRDVADHFNRLLHGKTAVSPDRKHC